MKIFEKVNFFDYTPETSAYYDTDMGLLKYDSFTRSFYKNGSPIKVTYFFKVASVKN